jgi:hypothetical protein
MSLFQNQLTVRSTRTAQTSGSMEQALGKTVKSPVGCSPALAVSGVFSPPQKPYGTALFKAAVSNFEPSRRPRISSLAIPGL